MAERDYYEILGVARDASPAEIRAAFRKLAHDYHPDRYKAPDAEIKFREVNEAYSVLSDPEKRTRYDRFGYKGFGNAGVNFFGNEFPGDPTTDAPSPKPKRDDED